MKRILSTVLAVTLLLNLFAILPITADAQEAAPAAVGAEVDTADTSASYSADWRLWSQGASDYAIMRSYGCWVTAMSKMFRQSEIATDITPDDFYWWERNNGWLPDNDYNLNQIDGANAPVAFAGSRGKTLELVTVNDSPSTDALWSYINGGYYTIIKVNASFDHYVYIENSSSKAQNDIIILESFYNQNEVGSYSLAERYGGAVTAYVYNYYTDYEYNLNGDGTAVITSYTGSGGDVTIPTYLGGYVVKKLSSGFQSNIDLTSVIIPNSVTDIGGWTFASCTNLTSVTIPDSVTTIGDSAFGWCEDLTSVIIPNSVTTIGENAFGACTSLASVKIGNSVMTIGNYAFGRCTSLTSVNIPNSVTTIGNGAFSYCEKLRSVNIPNSATTLGERAFEECTKLTSVNIGNSVTTISPWAFYHCTNLKSVAIPNSVTTIGGEAFCQCESLTSVNIPNSVTSIGDYAFANCTSLMNVNIPNSVTSIGEMAFYWCENFTSVTIPNSVTTIEYGAFASCIHLKSISIPKSVTSIDERAFCGCNELYSVTIPSSVTNIGKEALGYDGSVCPLQGYTIFGVEGSAAQRYANENDFTFMKITEKKDGDTGVIIYAPEDVSVKAKVIDLAEDAVKSLLINHGFISLVAVYDITMWLYEESIQPDAPVPVSIPCDNEKTKVYRQEDDGSLTDMHASYEDGYMVFYTDHFSTYILAVPESDGTLLGDADGDGDVTSIDVTYIQRYSAGLRIDVDEDTLMNGDADGNGELEIVDATFIQRRLAEMPIPYPVGE